MDAANDFLTCDVGRYRRHGHGPPVVILGNPQADPDWWAPPFVAALVDAGYEAVTFVHTGDSYAPAGVVRDVVAFVEHLAAGPVRLLGWSQGAAIAQEVALLRPDLVEAAALVATYGRQNSVDRILQAASSALDAAGPELDPVRLAMLLLTSYPPAALGDDAFVAPMVDAARAWSVRPAEHPEPRRRSAAFIAGYQERLDALAGVRVPCLVVGFGQDADTFVVRAREVANAIPGSRYVELPDAGHLTPVTEPHRVIDPVLAFFADPRP
ncbi:alpha/beta hydrolase [Polymorphospora rubra]|uniref:alpha/beta hydrolase n=1 Tax=Polymorphospora rubra TaxID=338584 RepID=UPI0033EE17FC